MTKKTLSILILISTFWFFVGYSVAPSHSQATITLTTPYAQSGPNIVSETDSLIGAMGICADQQTKILSLTAYPAVSQTLNAGKVVSITAGSIAPVVLTVNTVTGAYSTTNGVYGTLTGASLTGAQSWLAAALTPTMKNQAETWWSTIIFPGTTTAWQ